MAKALRLDKRSPRFSHPSRDSSRCGFYPQVAVPAGLRLLPQLLINHVLQVAKGQGSIGQTLVASFLDFLHSGDSIALDLLLLFDLLLFLVTNIRQLGLREREQIVRLFDALFGVNKHFRSTV